MTPALTRLTLVRASVRGDAGDLVTADGIWSLTHELTDDDETGDTTEVVVATHLATGLQLTHPAAGVDDWLMSGVALAELKAQAVDTFNGIALDDAKTAARVALVKLKLLLPPAAADLVECRCECGGHLALAAGGRLVHVDVCRNDLDPIAPLAGVVVVCDPTAHRICLDPAARTCGHDLCHARAYPHALPCQAGHEDCCGCCNGDV